MRSILEKAIVHLLNEEQDKAEALFHKFMVEKARRIHESLRSGEAVLAEGWDDEITSEEYVSEADLESVEDHDDDDDMAPKDAAGELGDDLDVEDADADADAEDADADAMDADADAMDADADADSMDGDAGDFDADGGDEPEAVEDRLADIEDQIEKLTADFDQMMGELDGEPGEEGLDDPQGGDMDGMGGDDMDGDGMGGDDMSAMGGDAAMGDDMGDDFDGLGGDDAMADRMEDDVTDDEHMPDDDMAETAPMDPMREGKKGKVPPAFLKNIKKKKGVKEEAPAEDEADDEDLDDITESVMAELERISVTMSDATEVGDGGKKVTTNDKLPLNPKARETGPKPVTIGKGPNHAGFERENAPSSKDYEKKKNTVRGKADGVLSKVPEKGDKSALINKDFAGSKQD